MFLLCDKLRGSANGIIAYASVPIAQAQFSKHMQEG